MGSLKIEGITHWSIPVNDLEESEKFYAENVDKSHVEEENVHHSFTVSPETLDQACKLFAEKKVAIDRLYYRAKGYFPGRELYFFDPSGNRLELRDPTWKAGMPEPSFEDLVRS